MKFFIGLAMVIGGLVLGAYVGIWVFFIGGICDVITQIRAEEMEAMGVAVGIAKVMFAGLAGWLSAVVLAATGMAIMND